MNWSGLPDISTVDRISDEDRRIMSEVKDVLERNSAVDRFGVTLLHSHFDLAADELLVETVDTKNRTLQIKVVSPSVAADADELVPTSWRLDGPEPVPLSYCWRSGDFHMQ